MSKLRVAYVIFPRHSPIIPAPTFAIDSARCLAGVAGLHVEVVMPLPLRFLKRLQSRSRRARGARAWPTGLDEVLLRLEPRPTLVPYLPLPQRSVESASLAIAAMIRLRPPDERPHVIIGPFLDEGGFAATTIARYTGAKSIAVACGSDIRALAASDYGPTSINVKRSRKAIENADQVIAVSRELAQEVVRRGKPAEVIHFTADPAKFPAGPFPPSASDVLFVGRLSRAKGVDLLLESFAKVRWPGAHLRLVGSRSEDLDVGAEVRRLGLSSRVTIVGELRHGSDELSMEYRGASCFVLPSRSEGFPTTVVEALLSGRPVVATDVGGVAELVSSKVGVLVPPDDSPALTNALDSVLQSVAAGNWSPQELRHYALPVSWEGSTPRLAAVVRRLTT